MAAPDGKEGDCLDEVDDELAKENMEDLSDSSAVTESLVGAFCTSDLGA